MSSSQEEYCCEICDYTTTNPVAGTFTVDELFVCEDCEDLYTRCDCCGVIQIGEEATCENRYCDYACVSTQTTKMDYKQMYEQMKEENGKLGEEICEILRKHREENKSYEEYSKNAERNLTFIKENMKLRNEIKKLKAEIVEREECEKLIMDIWARTNDRDQALPVHYRQKKENGEWGIDDDEEEEEHE